MADAYDEVIRALGAAAGEGEAELVRAAGRRGRVEEIRLRAGRHTQVVFGIGDELVEFVPDRRVIERVLDIFCEHSVYAREGEISGGFLTLGNGCRVGLCGRSVETGAGVSRMADISGMNIRIAREVRGCADALVPHITDDCERVMSTLIFAAPGVGKTTMLRDAARLLSDGGCGAVPHKVCIADERSELASVSNGVPRMYVGERTDVMDAAPKSRAMRIMIRAMSPDVIITDELGGDEDANAVAEAVRSGVRVLASVHADSLCELRLRPSMEELVRGRAFVRYVRLFREAGDVRFAVYDCEGAELYV